MTRFPFIPLWAALALVWASGSPPAVVAQPPVPELKTWPALLERDWSPMALRMRRAGRDWLYLEGPCCVVAGGTKTNLHQAAAEASAVHEFFSRQLGWSAPPAQRAVILLVGDTSAWTDLVARAHLRIDGEALQIGREIYIHAEDVLPIGRVAHEMTHYYIRDGWRLPLWLDEGLALHWGWQAVLQAGLGSYMPRRLDALSEMDLLPLDNLTARTTYPESPRLTIGFYRETEEMATTLAARWGEKGLAELAHDIVHRAGDWRAALAARGMDAAAVAEWEREVVRRCRESRVTP